VDPSGQRGQRPDRIVDRVMDQRIHGDRDDSSATPREVDAAAAGATAGIEDPPALQSGRQPGRDSRAHLVAAGSPPRADQTHPRIRRELGPGGRRRLVEVVFEPGTPGTVRLALVLESHAASAQRGWHTATPAAAFL